MQPHQQAGEHLLPLLQVLVIFFQDPHATHQSAHPCHRLQRPRKFTAGRQVSRRQPAAGAVFEDLQFRRANQFAAQPGGGFFSPPWLAGLEQGSHLGDAQPCQGLAQPLRVLLMRLEMLGLQQVAPGGFRVVFPQGALGPGRERSRQLGGQSGGAFMLLSVGLIEQPQRLFEAAVLHRLLGLSHRQPREPGHAAPVSPTEPMRLGNSPHQGDQMDVHGFASERKQPSSSNPSPGLSENGRLRKARRRWSRTRKVYFSSATFDEGVAFLASL